MLHLHFEIFAAIRFYYYLRFEMDNWHAVKKQRKSCKTYEHVKKVFFDFMPIDCIAIMMQYYAVDIQGRPNGEINDADALRYIYNFLQLIKSNDSILHGTRLIAERWIESRYLRFGTAPRTGLYNRTTGKEHYKVTRELASLIGDRTQHISFLFRPPTRYYAKIIDNYMPNLQSLTIKWGSLATTASDGGVKSLQLGNTLNHVLNSCGSLENVHLDLGILRITTLNAIAQHINDFKYFKLIFSGINEENTTLGVVWNNITRGWMDSGLRGVHVVIPKEPVTVELVAFATLRNQNPHLKACWSDRDFSTNWS